MSVFIEQENDVVDFFRSLARVYEKRCSEIMDNNPDSYTVGYIDKDSDDPIFKSPIRHMKPEYKPNFNDQIKAVVLEDFSKDDILLNYQDIMNATHGTFKEKLSTFLCEIYQDPYLAAYEAIKLSGLHWAFFGRHSDENTLKIKKSISDDLKEPFGDKRFSVDLLYANGFYGMSSSESNVNQHVFNERVYDDKTETYISRSSKRIFLDAKLGLLFNFKGKPSFYVGFFIDENLNVCIRQVQGLMKGRGHYVLGANWQRVVIQYLKEKLSFAKEILVLTEDSVFDYLKNLYNDNYNPTIHEPIFKKAASNYAMFNTGVTKSIKEVHAGGFKQAFTLNDVYYVI